MGDMDRSIEVVNGDILTGIKEGNEFDKFTIVMHGCNCFHTMGGGIALYLRNKFPEVYEVDKKTPHGSLEKLGEISLAHISDSLIVANCYTQFKFGSDKVHVDYKAVAACLHTVRSYFPHHHIRLPKIGCGLAGGDWTIVEKLYLQILADADYTVYDK